MNRSRIAVQRQFAHVAIATAALLSMVLATYTTVAYWHLRKIAAHQAGVRQSTAAVLAGGRLLSAMHAAEAGARGYLLTTRHEHLDSYQTALGDIARAQRALRETVADVPDHGRRLQAIDEHIRRRLSDLAAEVELASREGGDRARVREAESHGPQEMHEIRQNLRSIEQAELTRRDALRDAAEVSIHDAVVSLIISTIFSFAIMAVGFYVIQREMAARRKLAESLQAADRKKDDFLALLGHELRNPLAAIRNAIDVLDLLGSPSQPLEEMHGIINRQTAVMGRLVDDLLDVSRIAHGKIELRNSQLDLIELVERTIADTSSAVHGTDVTITLDAPHERVWVRGDATRLGQAIGNLLHNAVKFSPPAGLVSVRIEPVHAKHQVRVAVSDQGIGMNQRTRERVFHPFAQGAANGDRSQGGLGLGLALAKGLVELHGGEIEASSVGLGRGSTFTIALPLVPYVAPEEDRCGCTVDPPESCRVLIIDDRRDSSFPVQRMLEHGGHEVHVATNGAAGIALAQELELDVVFCDIGLPGGISGYDVARALRDSPKTATLFLVALTAYGDEEARRQALAAGFDRHLTKPASLHDIRSILSSLPCGAAADQRAGIVS
ncbi:MAG TPA: ATP-binding protein [Pirellulales bacterium]|nr:ATP-binding protein [Pirellulales bacterium]